MSTLSSANFTEGNMSLQERTQVINNKIKLHILGLPMNKLGNWLMFHWHSLCLSDCVCVSVCLYKRRKTAVQ